MTSTLDTTLPRKAKLVDLVLSGGTLLPVLATDPEITTLCPPREKAARLIDVITVPTVGLVPVFGVIQPCHKSWDSTPEFVDHDCVSTGTGTTTAFSISREFRAYFSSFDDCFSGTTCPEITLTYDEYELDWRGSIGLISGTLSLRVYCEEDPILGIVWWVEFSGDCVYGSAVSVGLSEVCDSPLIWRTAQLTFQCCAGELPPNVFATLTIETKNRPIHSGRLVEMVTNGGTLKPVFADTENCLDPCTEASGCCLGESIADGTTTVTIHSVTQTGGEFDCSDCLSGNTDTIPLGSNCVTMTLGGAPGECPFSAELCVTCDYEQSLYDGETGCEYYRLEIGSSIYEPTSCSCDPFVLEFGPILWTVPGGTPTACNGEYYVTVTR